MTGMEPSNGPIDRRPHETVPAPPVQGRGEIQMEAGNVVVTFHLPELDPSDMDYRVGTRTVSVWSKRPGFEFRTIVVLPKWVNPDAFILSHKNGVYEFLVETHQATLGVAG
jgi:hypothetical protein